MREEQLQPPRPYAVDSLAFLDSRTKQVVDAIDHVFGTLPKTGPISNRDFVMLSLLVPQMMSKADFNSLLGTIKKGMASRAVAAAASQDVGTWGWTGNGSKAGSEPRRPRDAGDVDAPHPETRRPAESSLFW